MTDRTPEPLTADERVEDARTELLDMLPGSLDQDRDILRAVDALIRVAARSEVTQEAVPGGLRECAWCLPPIKNESTSGHQRRHELVAEALVAEASLPVREYTDAERALGQKFLDVMDVSTADGISMGRAIRAALASQPSPSTDVDIARLFHEAYERLAPSFGYETRKASAVPWEDVPEPNRSLMIAVASEVAASLPVGALDVGTLTARLHADPALCGRYSPNGHPSWWLNPPCRQIAARLASPDPEPADPEPIKNETASGYARRLELTREARRVIDPDAT